MKTVPTIPRHTVGQLLDSAGFERAKIELLQGDFFATAADAEAFLSEVRRSIVATESGNPRFSKDAMAYVETNSVEALTRHFDQLHSAYDPATGCRNPGAVIPGPNQLYEEARRRSEASGRPYAAELKAVCDELRVRLPGVARVIEELTAVESDLLSERDEAQRRLDAANAKLLAARNQAVGIINSRDQLVQALATANEELKRLLERRAMLERRRSDSAAYINSSLEGPSPNFHFIEEMGKAVKGFETALAVADAKINAKKHEIKAAEQQLAEHLVKHEKALELVPTTR